MAASANKRSLMTLFTGKDDIYCHQVRIVLAEKGVTYETQFVDPNGFSEELAEVNPYSTVPTLVDRELSLYNARIVMEYLDERFPHPPLMPVYPVLRGRSRLMMYRIERDWYKLAHKILNNAEDAAVARKELEEAILALAPVFADTPYFLSEEFSLVDCYLAPLLWRLPQLGIDIEMRGAPAIQSYMARVFERESFQASLTDVEREMRL